MLGLIMIGFLSILRFLDKCLGLCADLLNLGELVMGICFRIDFFYFRICVIEGLPEFIAMEEFCW
jgi:hypothetical protein